MQIAKRFAVFTEEGKFMSSVEFLSAGTQGPGPNIAKSNAISTHSEVLGFIDTQKCDEMGFVAMSNSNEYFLFHGPQIGTFTVYTLRSKGFHRTCEELKKGRGSYVRNLAPAERFAQALD